MSSRITDIKLLDFVPFVPNQVMTYPATNSNSRNLAEVQLITGENGTGKTRLLSFIAAAFGNPSELTKRMSEQCGYQQLQQNTMTIVRQNSHGSHILGTVHGLAGHPTQFPFCMAYHASQGIRSKTYQPLYTSTLNVSDQLIFDKSIEYNDAIYQRLVNSVVKAGIASATGDTENRSLKMLSRLSATMSNITHRNFVFSLKEEPNNSVMLTVAWGEKKFLIPQSPDGLRAVFLLLAYVCMSLDIKFESDLNVDIFSQPFVLILDEPETYLHPRWQRLLLPAVQQMFPKAQIICATHSPFVISSVNEGYIHILRFNDEGKVLIDPPRECSKGDTYQDAVADVLGLSDLLDYDPETQALLEKFNATRRNVRTEADFDRLKPQALAIAERSERLSFLMGQQMHQLKVQLDRSIKQSHA
jgi:predicted ATP-binding protein involved in virulence